MVQRYEILVNYQTFSAVFIVWLSMLVAQIQADEDKHGAKEEVDGDGL